MSQVFIYENNVGGVTVGYPTNEALQILSIYEIAKKDSPKGKEFWIIDRSSLPINQEFFDAWELDKTSLGQPDGIGEG